MMAGIHHMEQLGFGDAQHLEFHPLATCADSQEECSSPDPEANSDMEQELQPISNDYNALQNMVDIGMPIVLNPAFVMCGTNFHLEPQLTFSSNGFKIEYLDSDSGQVGNLRALSWEFPDIISIGWKWVQMVQFALITLHVRSSAVNSGPDKVQFCLADPQWEWKQQKIWQLDSRYKEVWKNIPLDDFASQNWSADAEPSLCFLKQYFNGIDDFEELIYPKGDREAVAIKKEDVEFLLPETFVNDTIIDFYIKYLSTRIKPTERCRYQFFNCFFFRKLADLDKDQEKAPKGREAFLCVRKWTRKIDIFAKDFLFIPVNFSLHWSLLVICYPGEVDTFDKDCDARFADKVPCIMHMNSIKGTHRGLKDIIQSYLWEEWKERHPESTSDSSDKFLNLRFLSLEVPQQDNLFDCGLFLLHYVERFLMDAPSLFNPMIIDIFSSFLGDNWFVPAEASLKRSVIRKLIQELVIEPSKTYPRLVCGGEKHDESHHRSEKAVGEPSREYLAQGRCAAEPDSEKGLSVPVCILETEGVSMVAQQEIQVCPSDDDVVVCSPSQDAKNKPFFAHSGNQLDGKSCAPEDAEELKGSCFVLQDKNSHQESLLDIFETGGVSMVAEQEMQVCPSDDDVVVCSPSQDAKKDDDAKMAADKMNGCDLDASHDSEDGNTDWAGSDSEHGDDSSEAKKDKCCVGAKRPFPYNSTCEADEMVTLDSQGYSERTEGRVWRWYKRRIVSSESQDRNSGGIMSSDSAVPCGLTQGNVAGGTANGASGSHADGEDACHDLATGEAAPACEDDTKCTDAEIPHVNGISSCSGKDETYSEKGTCNARRPLLGSTSSEDKSILVPDDMCSLKGVECTDDGITKGSTKEETSTLSDKIHDSAQYDASSELGGGYTGNGIAGETTTQGTGADGYELAAFSCEGGRINAEMPLHVDGANEDEKNSIFDSVCKAEKTQFSEDLGSTTLEDGTIEGSTKVETDMAGDKTNGSEQYDASYESDDGNTDWAGSEQHDDSCEVKNEECCVGAKRPFPGSSSMEMVTFWQCYSKRTEGRFGRWYRRRIVCKRRKVISRTPPPSSSSECEALYWPL